MTGRSRGFGFVWFRDKRGLDEAVDKMHNSELDGRRISVARAVPQSETAPGTPADLLRRGQPYPREGGGRYDRWGGGGQRGQLWGVVGAGPGRDARLRQPAELQSRTLQVRSLAPSSAKVPAQQHCFRLGAQGPALRWWGWRQPLR